MLLLGVCRRDHVSGGSEVMLQERVPFQLLGFTELTENGDQSSKRLEQAGWGIDSTFQEVPAGCLKGNLWTPVFWGRWNFKENIGVLEARAVLKSVQRLALTRYGHDLRHLHLCDNLGVVLSIERCRSKNLKLLKILR